MTLKLTIAALKQRLSPRRSVALGLEALGWCDAILDDQIAWPDVRGRVRSAIFLTLRSERGNRIMKDDQSAARLVLEVIAADAFRCATSGHNHIYRGTLSYAGQSYRNICEIATHELAESGYLDSDELTDSLERLEEGIRHVG